jgi:DNA uptake protein ComE-like DNA-binding protein
MKKLLSLAILLSISSLTISCDETKEKVSDVMKQELFELHDKIMPRTMQVADMKAKLDSMSTDADSANIAQIKSLLDKSSQGMMDWMHNFDLASLDSMSMEEKLVYLKEQIAILKKVDEETDSSFNEYEKFTNSHQ